MGWCEFLVPSQQCAKFLVPSVYDGGVGGSVTTFDCAVCSVFTNRRLGTTFVWCAKWFLRNSLYDGGVGGSVTTFDCAVCSVFTNRRLGRTFGCVVRVLG